MASDARPARSALPGDGHRPGGDRGDRAACVDLDELAASRHLTVAELRRVRRSHATMSIDAVPLLDVAADPDAKTITWQPVARIPRVD
jgi:hypothetical protein